MKVLEARKARLSEGVCPACHKRLLRVQGEGVCTCCRYSWRLRNSEIEVRVPDDGEWMPDVEGPQGCLGEGSMSLDGGAEFHADRTHIFHLSSDRKASESRDG